MENLRFKLEAFEGPLDLLLHLIQKNKVNIYDIPISLITDQYMEYLEQMKSIDLDISSEFLLMAAGLLLIKSRMLLPKHEEEEEEEEDPRQELIMSLVEYKKYKELSVFFADRKSICDYLYFKNPTSTEEYKININPTLDIDVLTGAFERVMERIESQLPPSGLLFSGIVGREPVPVKTKLKYITNRVYAEGQVAFDNLFDAAESRSEVVAIFLAVLELVRNFKISIGRQNGEIFILGGENV